VATSPEIIHGTTPAQDLFSVVAASRSIDQICARPFPGFSTGLSFFVPWACAAAVVGKLWTMVNKPAPIPDVRLISNHPVPCSAKQHADRLSPLLTGPEIPHLVYSIRIAHSGGF